MIEAILSSTVLLVPMTSRCNLGDRAFPVAAAQVWNSLPTTLTSQSSLLTFRQQLKTFLFEQSYLWHPCYIALDTTFLCFNFFDIVMCPWSSLRTKCHVNLFLYEGMNEWMNEWMNMIVAWLNMIIAWLNSHEHLCRSEWDLAKKLPCLINSPSL